VRVLYSGFWEPRRRDNVRTFGKSRRLAEAVVAMLSQEKSSVASALLHSFSLSDWERSYYWLDASGVALYFLEAITQQHLESLIPVSVLNRLEQNQADNKRRSADLFEEFIKINEAFRGSGVRYVALKGFALSPDYCRDLTRRYQLDLDFLISPTDDSKCRDVMEQMGYRLKGVGDYVAEFQAGEDRPPALHRLYKPRSERSVELHLAISQVKIFGTDELIDRSESRSSSGYAFPVLASRDMFLAQAFHLLRHIRGEWTRLSWLREFRHFVRGRCDDVSFWRDVREHAQESESSVAIGIVTMLTTELFGEFAPRELIEWTVDTLPTRVRMWINQYGRQAMLAEFPGTKLYLLLEQELASDTTARRHARRRKLLPVRLPGKVAASATSHRVSRMRGSLIEARYILFRLRFHIAAGVHYLLEAGRWKRALRLAGEVDPRVENADRHTVTASGIGQH
jgi:Uncharacterised nucleotidyltransferase